jgi:rhodanese-related sulfurtransferase
MLPVSKIIIDVREPAEFTSSHVDDSVNIPLSKLMHGVAAAQAISKDKEIVLYCNSGNRSALAKNIFENFGFSKVTNGISQQHIEQSNHA